MGGQGSGGARIGGGQKPKAGRPRREPEAVPPGVLRAITGGVREAPAAEPERSPLEVPPKDLTKAGRAIWASLAPQAVKRGTLVEATVEGFRELVELRVMRDGLRSAIPRQPGGVGGPRAMQLRRQVLQMTQRIDQMLGRFKLTSFGKPDEDLAAGPSKKAAERAVNPWEAVG